MRHYVGFAAAFLLTAGMAWGAPMPSLIGDQVNGNISWALGGIVPNGSWTGVTANTTTAEFTGTFQHDTPGETMEFSVDITGDNTFTLTLFNNRDTTAGVFPVTAVLSDLDWVGAPGRQIAGITPLSAPMYSSNSMSFTPDSVTVTVQPSGGAIGGYSTLSWSYSIQPSSVPEPASAMAVLGLLPVLALRRRRNLQA